MGKMLNTLILSGIISLVLFLIDGTGEIGVIAKMFVSPPTDFADFILNALTSELGLASVSGAILIGIGAFIKQDWLIRGGMFTVLVSWIQAPFIRLWTFIASKIFTTTTCTSGDICGAIVSGSTTTTLGAIVAGLFVGPIILYAFWACWCQIWSPESSG